MKHQFWGNIREDWNGFSSDINFSHPFFGEQHYEIFLGEEDDEDGEEIENSPSQNQLDEMAETYQVFIKNADQMLEVIQQESFNRYQKLYAHYYEDPDKSGEESLSIDTVEKHNPFIKDLMYIRICEQNTIKISIRYKLDTEHGLEFKFADGALKQVGGIGET